MNKYMEIAKNKSIKGFKNKEGGPFGAVITDKDGNIIAEGKVIPAAILEIVNKYKKKLGIVAIAIKKEYIKSLKKIKIF